MLGKFTAEQVEKAKDCNTVEALTCFAKGCEVELTEAQAMTLFAQLHPTSCGVLDEELRAVVAKNNAQVIGQSIKDLFKNLSRKQ